MTLDGIILSFVFLFGAIIGSFLNVVIYRLNTGKTLMGRSFCLYCGKELKFYEMIPILSFLYLKGRCATCKSRISIQYPLVELTTSIIFLLSYCHALNIYTFPTTIYYSLFLFVIGSLLIVISVYDIRHTIIPDSLVIIFGLLSLFQIFIFPLPEENLAYSLLSGPALALPFALVYYISQGRFMGLGDAKLVLGIGWLLGMTAGGLALLFSFWIGGLISLILLYLKAKSFTMKSEIPFAPFLVLGTFTALFVPMEYFVKFIILS